MPPSENDRLGADSRTAPDDDPAAIESLLKEAQGVEVFKPGSRNIGAALLLAFLTLSGGSMLLASMLYRTSQALKRFPAGARQGGPWFAIGLGILGGVVLIAGGLAAARYALRLRRDFLLLSDEGFMRHRGGKTDTIRWGDIAKIQELISSQDVPVFSGPARALTPSVTNRHYWVFTHSGEKFVFGVESIQNFNRFREVFAGQATRHGLAIEQVDTRA